MLKKYTKPYPTIGNIIAGKNFDYVSYRGYDEKRNSPPALPDGTVEGEFCGCFKVVNGEIVPLDGDSYYDNEPIKKTQKKRKKIGILVHTPGRINLPGVVPFQCFQFSAY